MFAEADLRTESPMTVLTRSKVAELEDASLHQAEIIAGIEDALNDMNIETSNTESRLNLLEAVAAKQKKENHYTNAFNTFITNLSFLKNNKIKCNSGAE